MKTSHRELWLWAVSMIVGLLVAWFLGVDKHPEMAFGLTVLWGLSSATIAHFIDALIKRSGPPKQ